MYLFDAHVHTAESSRCGRMPGAEVAEIYAKKGYSGIIITDHFINCNTRADRNAPWEEQVAVLMAGYKAAKARGDEIGLKVFFGFEGGSEGNDFLTYGLGEEWLLKHPESAQVPLKEYLALVRSEGGFVVHAHPYRRAHYIKCIRLLPDEVDAVEITNLCRPELDNRLAKIYAEAYGLPATAGSDAHTFEAVKDFVIGTDTPIESVADYIERVKQGRLTLA